MSLKGAIFDMDGVLVDTVPLHFKAWKKMFSEYGKRFTFRDYIKKVDGIPRLDGARAILKELSQKELEEAAGRKQDYFLKILDKEGVAVFRDAIVLIKKLRKKRVKTAAISSSRNCRHILKKARIDRLFNVIISGRDIERGKPQPDIFLTAAKRLKARPHECIVFEDSVLGVAASRRGGIKCIGIDRHGDPQRLGKADRIVNSLKKINLKNLEALLA